VVEFSALSNNLISLTKSAEKDSPEDLQAEEKQQGDYGTKDQVLVRA
jgi:hypothetical protein